MQGKNKRYMVFNFNFTRSYCFLFLAFLVCLSVCIFVACAYPESDNDQPIFQCIENNDLACVQSALKQGGDLNSIVHDGLLPLHLAVSLGFSEIVDFLIEHGADVNAQTDLGETSLHLVSLIEDDQEALAIAKNLIDHFADLNIVESIYKTTPLFWQNKIVTEYFIEKGADINYIAKDGYTPLFWQINSDADDVAELLLQKGANLTHVLDNGTTAIHLACFLDNFRMVKLLVDYGADINQKDGSGHTPLQIAKSEGNEEIRKFLLGKGAKESTSRINIHKGSSK